LLLDELLLDTTVEEKGVKKKKKKDDAIKYKSHHDCFSGYFRKELRHGKLGFTKAEVKEIAIVKT